MGHEAIGVGGPADGAQAEALRVPQADGTLDRGSRSLSSVAHDVITGSGTWHERSTRLDCSPDTADDSRR
jgi:hypothetical protein